MLSKYLGIRRSSIACIQTTRTEQKLCRADRTRPIPAPAKFYRAKFAGGGIFSQPADLTLCAKVRTDHGVVSRVRLPICAILCDFKGVNCQITIRSLVAILVIAGLALAPVSGPVMAQSSSEASTQAMADGASPSAMTEEMASDMPCCPSKAPAPIDCGKCVFMAACMSKCFTGMLATVVHPFRVASDRVAVLRNDARLDGLGHLPPEHPPRTLV
jgi:hypothetical protein